MPHDKKDDILNHYFLENLLFPLEHQPACQVKVIYHNHLNYFFLIKSKYNFISSRFVFQ